MRGGGFKITAGKNSGIKCKSVTPLLNCDLNFNMSNN